MASAICRETYPKTIDEEMDLKMVTNINKSYPTNEKGNTRREIKGSIVKSKKYQYHKYIFIPMVNSPPH